MKSGKLAIGAVIGAAVGVVAGIMTAPKSGKETREEIKRKATEAKDTATAKKDSVLFRVEEVTDDLKSRAAETLESVKPSGRKKK
jgi:gas vesicle protein